MAEFVFTSPGVKFKERDLTYVVRNVGITCLGLVGETLKGPAFEPVFVQDSTQFTSRFGGQSTQKLSNGNLQYQLPYVANSYLSETNQLWVTRVLGLSGYDAGNAWAITLSAGVDPSTVASSGIPVVSTHTFTNNQYLGVALMYQGQTGTYSSGFTKHLGNTFTEYVHTFTATTLSMTGSGTTRDKVTLFTGTSYSQYENMVLAVIRSRGTSIIQPHSTQLTTFDTTILTVSGNTTNIGVGDLFSQFMLRAYSTGSTQYYTVSLNPNSSSFLPNVIGSAPKDKKTKIWVQAIYPDLIQKLDSEGIGYGINTTLITATSNNFTNYKIGFQTPETPWVVSQLMGNHVNRLFKFISISDGDAANDEIKISIVNINPDTYEFDVVVRDFNDTDASPIVLETYSKCTMIEGLSSYIAQKIGTTDGIYNLASKYIMVELATDIPNDVFPAGFEGYEFNDYAMSATSDPTTNGIPPKIFYKTKYSETDKVNKVFLGISEHGYDSTNSTGSGINQNFFNYNGQNGFVKTKGFHMDSGATGIYTNGTIYIGQFEVGAGQIQTYLDTNDPLNPYYSIKTRKFTFVPARGFDGWDVNRGINGEDRSYGDGYQQGGIFSGHPGHPETIPTNDFHAWQTAINTFSNPEQVTINLFSTPGINWSDQSILVQDTIDMIEQQRTDSLYVIDSPNIDINITNNGNTGVPDDVEAAQQVVELLNDVDIDSSYSCTYFPWIQIRDNQNNVNVYIPATGEVVRAMAFTDNVKFPWFAPAGLNRGVTNAIKSRYKLSQEARDILYAGRINPMADFAEAGTAIFGQKTLQVKESALDRINVRRLLLQIKVLIANIAIRLVFEQNDQTTIDQFLAKANPILDSIKRERGLNDFRIKMDNSNNTPETMDRNELYGEIFLKPTRAVEFIGITFTITPSGASFADVGA
jgi:hypothetical protein